MIKGKLGVRGCGASQVALVVKNLPVNAGDIRDTGLILHRRSSPGGGNGNPCQYSCLENAMDRGAWEATVHRLSKSQTQLKWLSMHSGGGEKWSSSRSRSRRRNLRKRYQDWSFTLHALHSRDFSFAPTLFSVCFVSICFLKILLEYSLFTMLCLFPLHSKVNQLYSYVYSDFPGGSDCNEFACKSGDPDSVPGLGRSPGEVNVYPIQYSCLENSMDKETWQATFHGVTRSWTWLCDNHFHFFFSYIYSLLGDSFPIQPITECWVELPVVRSWSLLVVCFMYESVYLSVPISLFIPLLTTHFPPGISLFSTSVTLYLFCK